MKTNDFLELLEKASAQNKHLQQPYSLLIKGMDFWKNTDREDFDEKMASELTEDTVHHIIAVVSGTANAEMEEDRWYNNSESIAYACKSIGLAALALIRKAIQIAKENGVEVHMNNHESFHYNLRFCARLSLLGAGKTTNRCDQAIAKKIQQQGFDGLSNEEASKFLLSGNITLHEWAEKEVETMLA